MARGLCSVLTGVSEAGAKGSTKRMVAPYTAALEQAILGRALDRGLPLLVSNPDVLRPDGKCKRLDRSWEDGGRLMQC
jgi:hypothetical protein